MYFYTFHQSYYRSDSKEIIPWDSMHVTYTIPKHPKIPTTLPLNFKVTAFHTARWHIFLIKRYYCIVVQYLPTSHSSYVKHSKGFLLTLKLLSHLDFQLSMHAQCTGSRLFTYGSSKIRTREIRPVSFSQSL